MLWTAAPLCSDGVRTGEVGALLQQEAWRGSEILLDLRWYQHVEEDGSLNFDPCQLICSLQQEVNSLGFLIKL